MEQGIIFLMDVSLTGKEKGRSTITRFKNIANLLASKNVKVHWFSCRGKRRIISKKKFGSINDFSFHSKLRVIYPFIVFFFSYYFMLRHRFLKILCYFPSFREGFPSMLMNIVSNKKISYYLDYMDLSPKFRHTSSSNIRFLEGVLEKIITIKAKKVSVISSYLFHWVKSLGIPPERIQLIPLCTADIKKISEIDIPSPDSFVRNLEKIKISEEIISWINQIKSDDSSYLIGYQGVIAPHQGLEPVIAAFSDTRLGSYYLLLAGGANTSYYENKIKQLIKRPNDENRANIRYTGYLRHEDIQLIISFFDYGIIPKPSTILSQATFPSKALRYLIEGIPIIATRSGWLKELIRETGGELIENNTMDSIIRTIQLIKQKRRLDADQWRYILSRFSTSKNLLAWLKLLEF